MMNKVTVRCVGLLIPLLATPQFPATVLHVGGISDSCDVYRWVWPLCLI